MVGPPSGKYQRRLFIRLPWNFQAAFLLVPFNRAAWMPHSQEGPMQPNQPSRQEKTPAPTPGPQNPERYEFGLWKVFRALAISILITAGLLLIIQFVFKIRLF